jgi:hypothetical protein
MWDTTDITNPDAIDETNPVLRLEARRRANLDERRDWDADKEGGTCPDLALMYIGTSCKRSYHVYFVMTSSCWLPERAEEIIKVI